MAWLELGAVILSSLLMIARLLFSTEFILDDKCAIWIADAHRDNGKCFVVRVDVPSEKKQKAPAGFPTEALFLARDLFAVGRAEFSQLGRVADLRDEPRFRSDIRCHLLLNRLADWRRPEGNRVTHLSDGDVVLASILTEEQSLFAVKQTGEVQPTYRHVDF
jgi:hypothetical protein